MSEQDKKYHPDSLPTKITKPVYLYYEVRGCWAGELRIWGQDMAGEDRLLLAQKDITISIPRDLDLKTKMVEALESQKSRLLADTHMKVKELQEKVEKSSKEEYQRLQRASEEWRVHSEQARLALEQHLASHKC